MTGETADGKLVEIRPGEALSGVNLRSVTITPVDLQDLHSGSQVQAKKFREWLDHLLTCRMPDWKKVV